MVQTRTGSSSSTQVKKEHEHEDPIGKGEEVEQINHHGEIFRKGDFVLLSPIKEWRAEVNKSLNAKNYSEKYDGIPWIGEILALWKTSTKHYFEWKLYWWPHQTFISTRMDFPKQEVFSSDDKHTSSISRIRSKCIVKYFYDIENLEDYCKSPKNFFFNLHYNPKTFSFSNPFKDHPKLPRKQIPFAPCKCSKKPSSKSNSNQPTPCRECGYDFKSISLYTGCGGLDLGFREAGIPCKWAVEYDADAVATFRKHFPETECWEQDTENQLKRWQWINGDTWKVKDEKAEFGLREAEDDYTVEAILEHKEDNGVVLYKIKWEGYEDEEDQTWETEDHLQESEKLLNLYKRNQRPTYVEEIEREKEEEEEEEEEVELKRKKEPSPNKRKRRTVVSDEDLPQASEPTSKTKSPVMDKKLKQEDNSNTTQFYNQRTKPTTPNNNNNNNTITNNNNNNIIQIKKEPIEKLVCENSDDEDCQCDVCKPRGCSTDPVVISSSESSSSDSESSLGSDSGSPSDDNSTKEHRKQKSSEVITLSDDEKDTVSRISQNSPKPPSDFSPLPGSERELKDEDEAKELEEELEHEEQQLEEQDEDVSFAEEEAQKEEETHGTDPHYEVEEVVDMKFEGNKKKFLIKWKGYPSSQNTWEPKEHLNCPEKVQQFRMKMRNDPNTPKPGQIAKISGGPPCQGASSGNANRSKFYKYPFDEPRTRQMKIFFRYVKYFKPWYVVIENVTAFLRENDSMLARLVMKVLLTLGYQCHFCVLNAAMYGVPQVRHRIIFLAALPEYQLPNFPQPTHLPATSFVYRKVFGSVWCPIFDSKEQLEPPMSVIDAIGDLPEIECGRKINTPLDYRRAPFSPYQELMRANHPKAMVFDHTTKASQTRFSPMPKEKPVPEEGALPPDLCNDNWLTDKKYTRKVLRLPQRLTWAHPFFTMVTRPNVDSWAVTFHPAEDRLISLRETARAQSFPDWFTFEGNQSSGYMQAGNAVPPLLAFAIGKEIVKAAGMEIPLKSQFSRFPLAGRKPVLGRLIPLDDEDISEAEDIGRPRKKKILHPSFVYNAKLYGKKQKSHKKKSRKTVTMPKDGEAKSESSSESDFGYSVPSWARNLKPHQVTVVVEKIPAHLIQVPRQSQNKEESCQSSDTDS